MRRSVVVPGLFVVALGGCGGRQGLSPPDDSGAARATAAILGPVDLTQAPRQLTLSCDQGVGQLAFDNPCQVGTNLSGRGGIGVHETECHFDGMAHPVAWSFLVPLSQIAADPTRPLAFPADFPPTPTATTVEVDGYEASVVGVVGTVSFSRVDPSTRAFSASFKGTISWTGNGKFSCAVDGPLWGAPGGFE